MSQWDCRSGFIWTCVTCLIFLVSFSTLQNEWIKEKLLHTSLWSVSKSQSAVVPAYGKRVTGNYNNLFVFGNNKITLNETSKNATKDALIDLDIFVPSVDVLYERLVLVTAFSSNHYNEAMGFIGSAHKQMPGKKIIVYDLGMNQTMKEKVESLCNVERRQFPFQSYPPHVRSLLTYAFKPILINLALNEFGAIYYGDASIRFLKSLKELLPGIEHHHGYMTVIRGFDPRHMIDNVKHHYYLTVPEMFEKLEVDRDEYLNSNFSSPHIQPGTQLIINSTTVQTKLIQPWLNCALDETCIAPPGSNKGNHRQDASAITLIVYKNMYREWTTEDYDTEKMRSVIVVRRDSDGFKHNPRYC